MKILSKSGIFYIILSAILKTGQIKLTSIILDTGASLRKQRTSRP